jgi:hypothetical protein
VSEPLDVQTLNDERALERAMGRYARALDARDWGALDEVFAADAVAHYGADAKRFGNFQADVCGDRATTRTYVRVFHRARDAAQAHLSLETFAEYVVDWARMPQGWRAVDWRLELTANVGDPAVLGL